LRPLEPIMSLFSKLLSGLLRSTTASADGPPPVSGWRALLTPLGVTAPVCPACGHAFDKMPQRKRACPACQQPIYSRKRPLDGVKVLLTEQQAKEGEGQDALLGRMQTADFENADPTSTIEALRTELGRAPTAEDVVERHLLVTAQKHAADWQWGLYRNARFSLAESRSRRDRREDALRLYLEVCLVDLNGPRNCGTKDPAITEFFPAFDPTTAFLAPGVVSRAATVARELGLSPGDLRHQFEAVAESVRSLKLPRPTAEAWNELESALPSRGT
jgi:hypothetical protein